MQTEHVFLGERDHSRRAAETLQHALVTVTDILSGTLLMSLVGLLVLSILSRDLLHVPIPWLEEIATLVTIYAVAFASIGAWARGAHIAVELVPLSIKGRWHDRYGIFLQLFSLAFLCLTAWGAFEMMERSVNNRTTALSLSFSIYYGGLLLGFAGMALASVLRLWGAFSNSSNPKD
ncbi:TRAP transporter small permease [Roseibium aggregatum]|uniref:TRAP transporter small permease protein n=1 Tax=Roseibium aggregatum TaxID=187304 RepID=A0A939J505_9HYPH|nr:TRAP transporter small permease [Roseibium aggregatum]MBN9672177.1 TRAP transporter small permease [Roseibium aggregatum]